MKITALILSIYIFALTAIPCIDKAHHDTFSGMQISQNTNNTHHEQETDHCSPFCTCVCCATSAIHQDYCIYNITFSDSKEQKSVYKFSFVPSLSGSIWQPPKLS